MTKALIIVDMQRDFLPGGALGVSGGDEIIEPIVARALDMGPNDIVVTTQDWHPADTRHWEKWPVHCVRGGVGAELTPRVEALDVGADHAIFKGTGQQDDGYSGFEGFTPFNESLEALLRRWEVTEVVVVGLALDYCVKATALDAARLGFDVVVPLAETRPVADSTGRVAVAELLRAGVAVTPLCVPSNRLED